MTGNTEDKFHKEVLSGKFGFLQCLQDRPAIQRKYKKCWTVLSQARKDIATKNPTTEHLVKTAAECAKFTKIFQLERRFANQFNKAQQYYLMLREYENSLYVHI